MTDGHDPELARLAGAVARGDNLTAADREYLRRATLGEVPVDAIPWAAALRSMHELEARLGTWPLIAVQNLGLLVMEGVTRQRPWVDDARALAAALTSRLETPDFDELFLRAASLNSRVAEEEGILDALGAEDPSQITVSQSAKDALGYAITARNALAIVAPQQRTRFVALLEDQIDPHGRWPEHADRDAGEWLDQLGLEALEWTDAGWWSITRARTAKLDCGTPENALARLAEILPGRPPDQRADAHCSGAVAELSD